jgi:hypothetical protein
MSAGHGRGYYGGSQLDRPRRRSSSGWFKIAAVVGLGAVIWFMLPRGGSKHEELPSPPSPPPDEGLEQLARSRGFSSSKMYEDSVIANARELKAAGAKVELGPHLQHLEDRLES